MQLGIAAARQAPASPDEYNHYYGEDLDEETAADLEGAAIHQTNALAAREDDRAFWAGIHRDRRAFASTQVQETNRRKRASEQDSERTAAVPEGFDGQAKRQKRAPRSEDRTKADVPPTSTQLIQEEFEEIDDAELLNTEAAAAPALPQPAPKAKRGQKNKPAAAPVVDAEPFAAPALPEPAPKAKRGRKKKQAAVPDAEEAAPAPKAKRSRKKKQAAASDTEKAEFADFDAAAANTEATDTLDLAIPSIDGETMLSLLRQAVRDKLGQDWLSKLDLFLKSVREDPLQTPQSLQEDLENRWQLFKEAEPRAWSDVGEPAKSSDNLIKFDGDCSAKVCVVMHYPTFSKSVKTFFDAENPCLDRMMKKGLLAETCFGFDIHHRQENSKDYKRDHCPGTGYPEAVRVVHTDLAFDLLGMIPARLHVLVGQCVQKTYAARFPKQAMRDVEVTVSGNRKVKFLLRTGGSNGNLASLAVCCPHPEGLFLANATEGPLRACQMDSGINTVMTLSSLPTRPDYFARFYEFNVKQRKQGGGVKANNPLNKISEILKEEETACEIKPRHEYPTWVLDWTTKTYPTVDLDDLESKGLSIAVAIYQAKSDKTAKTKYEKAEDKSNFDRDAPCRGTTSSAFDTRDWFHGGHVKIDERKGGCGWYITLDYQNPGTQQAQDSTRYRTTVSSPLLYKGRLVKLFFGKDSMYGLDDNDRYIFERSYASIRFQSYGSKFVERALLEYAHHQRGDVA